MRSSLVRALLTLITCCEMARPCETFALEHPERIVNGTFAEGIDGWRVDGGTATRGSAVCPGEDCLELEVPGSDAARIRQVIAELEPAEHYTIDARIRAGAGQRVRVGLHDENWRGPFCARKPLSIFVETLGRADGEGEWQNVSASIEIPQRDPCGPTHGHRWQLELEFEPLAGRASTVWIGDVRISRRIDPGEMAPGTSRPRCAYFRDHAHLDPCPGPTDTPPVSAAPSELVTIAKWMLDEGDGTLIHDYVSGRNGVIAGLGGNRRPDWRDGTLFFPGGRESPTVRIDAGQPIHGARFEISLEVSPAPRFDAGCLLSSRPATSRLGGFRLCLARDAQTLRFEVANGTAIREYTSILSTPIPSNRWTRIHLRAEAGWLEVFVGGQRVERIEARRLQLRRSPFPLVIGGSVTGGTTRRTDAGFHGKIRNVTLRGTPRDVRSPRPQPLGHVTRGSWPLDEGSGIVVRDRASNHHGVIEDTPKRRAAQWEGERLTFGGTPDAGGVVIRNAGPIYGDAFAIAFEMQLDDPRRDSGTLLANKTGMSVQGGFKIGYSGPKTHLSVNLADGERQVIARAKLPFVPPAGEWIPVQIRFAHDRLDITVASIDVQGFVYPGFALARTDRPMIVGAYYYPPTKGVKGSIRNVELRMRAENVAATGGDTPAPSALPCVATALRDKMIVGSNVLVPNWFGASCKSQRQGEFHTGYVVELSEEYELEATGASEIEDGRLVHNEFDFLGWRERDGTRYRAYRVELNYLRESGGVFGPLFVSHSAIASADPDLSREGQNAPGRLLLYDEEGAENAAPVSIELEHREFPILPPPRAIHHSLAWMGLPHSMSWPDFMTHYGALGFNVVPTLALYDRHLAPSARKRFIKKARRHGYEVLVVDSPYHSLIVHEEARTLTDDETVQPYVDPSYRGPYYEKELARVGEKISEVDPEWVMLDIECFEDGAFACLTGTSTRCREHLARIGANPERDIADAVMQLGTELIANLRRRIDESLPRRKSTQLGINTSEPRHVYHRLFDFDALYDAHVDYAQPVLYRSHPKRMGERIRESRANLESGDIIPWLDPGSVAEFPSVEIYDRVLEVFGSGARGIAWFQYSKFEGADFYYLAKAMESIIAVEDVIIGSRPMEPIQVMRGRANASGLVNGSHGLLLLSDYAGSSQPVTVTLRLPDGVGGSIWDVARRERVAQVGLAGRNEVTLAWRPGVADANTALFYVGPAHFEDDRLTANASDDAR